MKTSWSTAWKKPAQLPGWEDTPNQRTANLWATLIASIRENLPKTVYFKYIDVWFMSWWTTLANRREKFITVLKVSTLRVKDTSINAAGKIKRLIKLTSSKNYIGLGWDPTHRLISLIMVYFALEGCF